MTDKPTREEALKALSLIDENESKWESNQFEKEILIIRNYINSQAGCQDIKRLPVSTAQIKFVLDAVKRSQNFHPDDDKSAMGVMAFCLDNLPTPTTALT